MAEQGNPGLLQRESRRSVLKKGLVGTGVVLAAPVVSTAFTPASAAIASNMVNAFRTKTTDDPVVSGSTFAGLSSGSVAASCVPGDFAAANPTVSSDFDGGGGSASVIDLTTAGSGFAITVTVTLPTGCTFSSTDSLAFQVQTDGPNECLRPAVTAGASSATVVLNYSRTASVVNAIVARITAAC